MRIAALYDVHGNVHALDAVLAELTDERVDAVVLGGDVVGGPWPAETLDRLRSLPGDVRWLRGNGDRELLPGEEATAPAAVLEFVRGRLSDEQIAFLGALPPTLALEAIGLGRVHFCHATPRSDVEILTAVSAEERWREALAGVDEPVVVCGHTHVQFDRRVGPTRVVNAGSVGMAYEDAPGAYWALLGPTVELRRTTYDVELVEREIARSGYPEEWPRAARAEATAFFEGLVTA